MRQSDPTGAEGARSVVGASSVSRVGEFLPYAQRPVVVFLAMLLTIDLVFAVLHIVQCCFAVGLSSFFSLEKERGFGEVFQYIKALWAFLLLGGTALRTRVPVYFAWALVLCFLLLDDSMQIHERLGTYAATALQFESAYGLRPQDFGEALVALASAAVLLCVVVVTHRMSMRLAREDSWRLLIMVAALGVFGVFVDLLHSMADAGQTAALWGLLEDGGELVVMSLIAAFSFALYCRPSDRVD